MPNGDHFTVTPQEQAVNVNAAADAAARGMAAATLRAYADRFYKGELDAAAEHVLSTAKTEKAIEALGDG